MTSRIREKIIADRTSWIRQMISGIKALPQDTMDVFTSDPRTVAAAESYLRRGLEALMDIGRHVLAKGFSKVVSEYKDIPVKLRESGVLKEADATIMRELAGYRNRMVHFYDEISTEELYDISTKQLGDIDQVLNAILQWVQTHPEFIEKD